MTTLIKPWLSAKAIAPDRIDINITDAEDSTNRIQFDMWTVDVEKLIKILSHELEQASILDENKSPPKQ